MPVLRWIAALALVSSTLPAAAATAPDVRSDVAGIHIVAATTLPAPRRPMRFGPDHFCRNGVIDPPKTAAGKQAASLGWLVSSEQQAAGYTAIGVFSRGGQGTSGTCFIEDGNIVIYHDAQPVAIVYGDAPKEDEGGLIGGVVATLTTGRLRILDWTPATAASADIVLAADRIDVVAIADREIACGDITLPNLRNRSIPEMRKLLAPFGWSPAKSTGIEEDVGAEVSAYRRQGLTEVQDCAGTGYGFCSVRYTHRGGTVLNVTTMGDEPSVARYSVTCAGDTPR